MSSSRVTLGIAGTANSNGGIQPQIDIEYPESLEQDYPFDDLLGGDFIIELKHAPEYISLRYIARPSTVHSYQAGRPGRMWIGMTIPRGKRFAHNVSPYTVLRAVLDTFRQSYMNPRSDGSYEFKAGTYLRAPFDDLLENKYPLEDYPGRYVEMRGGGPAVICLSDEEELARFFADTQYPEFEKYSAIQVTLNLAWNGAGRIKVAIPRPISFQVFNAETMYAVLTSPDQRFDRTIPPPDDFHYPVPVSFSLAELRKGECSSYAKVDEAKEQIHLYPRFPDRDFRLEFEFRPSLGTLSDMQCDLRLFDLVASGAQRKQLQWEGEKCYATFVGMEANEHWDLRYDSGTSELQFKYVVTGLKPKEGGTAIVTLTPLAPFQGIKFSGARCLKEDAYLEVTFGNKDVFKRSVSRDGEIVRLPGRKEAEIKAIRIVSDRYSYPELNRSYDSVTGWISVLLSGDPILRETIPSGTDSEKSGKLVIENHTVGFQAMVLAKFDGRTSLEWGPVSIGRQASGEEVSLPIPSPYGTEKELKRVVLYELKELKENDKERTDNNHAYKRYKRKVFDSVPDTNYGECQLTSDSDGEYRIVIDRIEEPTPWEKVIGWMKVRRVRRWWLLVGLLAALLAGIGSCLAWQRYIQPKVAAFISTRKEDESQFKTIEDVRKKGTEEKDKEEGKDVEVDVAVDVEGSDANSRGSENGQSTNTFLLSQADAAKIGPYVYLMKNLQSPSGESLTFDKVKEIYNWQIGISNAAGNKDLGTNFNFIKKYIGQFSRAVNEINRIKNGEYRWKGWNVEDYYSNCKELIKISNNCPGDDLKRFRVAIQNLAIMGQDDLNPESKKYQFIRRAVLSGAPQDAAILSDVNSFKGISDKYNSQ